MLIKGDKEKFAALPYTTIVLDVALLSESQYFIWDSGQDCVEHNCGLPN